VVEAVNQALEDTGVTLSSYCLAPRWNGHVPHYVVLIEQQEAAGGDVMGRFCGRVEQLLRRANIEYNGKRASGRLGPLRLKVVPGGTWSTFDLDTMTERRRGMEQYKHKFLVGDVEFEGRFKSLAEIEGHSGDSD
jgi:hypothetical protein